MKELGKYEILEEIGSGGFGTVFKARDTSLDRVIALKVLHPERTFDPKFIQRFFHEARTAAGLRHPHVVTIHDVGEESGQYYLAMEYLPGEGLNQLVERGPLPVDRAITILEQIASALDYIGGQGLIHRDVKPSNIRVDETEQAALLDFGTVRAAEGTRLTTTMATLGTPHYMAPEQAEIDEGVEIDWRVDIYALGIVAYEMLVGRPPFTGRSPTGILYKHIHEPPPPPTELNPGLPSVLEPVLLKALAKDREARFQTAGAMTAALREAVEDQARAEQREARLDELYGQLSEAIDSQQWAEAEARYRDIHTLDPAYRDAPELWVQVRAAQARQREKAQAERIAAEKAEAERISAEKAEAALVAADKAEADRLTAEKAKAERVAAEEAEAELQRQQAADWAAEEHQAHLQPPSRPSIPRWAWIVGVLVVLSLVVVGVGRDRWFAAESTPTDTPMPTDRPTPRDTPTLAPTLTSVTPELAVGSTWIRLADSMLMLYVPADEFEMGSTDDGVDYAVAQCNQYLGSHHGDCEQEWFVNEQPAHTVAQSGFWIDRTEVTNAQYALCVATQGCDRSLLAGDSDYNGDDYPVVGVSWSDAVAYCESVGARLPTEAEWEYAARGPEGRTYPWGDELDDMRLNYCDASCIYDWKDADHYDGFEGAAPVASFYRGASWCGALDMAGNVAEWVADWYGDYASGRQVNPSGPASGQYRVLRGGSWYDYLHLGRGAGRDKHLPDTRINVLGFRCARDPDYS